MWKLGKNGHPSSPYPIVTDWVILIIKVNGLEIIGFLEGSLGEDPKCKALSEVYCHYKIVDCPVKTQHM